MTCFNCEFTECSKKPLKCPYGIAKDVCGCCDVCANGVGEECGGESGILGRCGKGLRCDRRPRGNEALPPEMTEGICVQDTTPVPPRRGPTKWRKLGEECGGRRGVYGKCVKGLRCDRSPRGNAATPIIQRKGVCAPATSSAQPAKVARRGPTIRPDPDKPRKRSRTTQAPVRLEEEPDNSLNPHYVPKGTPPLWYVREMWQKRRRDEIERDRKETARRRGLKSEKKWDSRLERPREATEHLRYD
ncbi:hypothetical protein J437_LFUL006450 [Ladona fulva]|uniref:IGFBP N-terminal domain-containing protein n=1 Tax=Ladona fulva TaxID=123851 RepID=A0A8K0JY22_LADFU|nr:hypothetical protein J437_LFUL006450 [Ladona fulva]